MNSGDKDIAKLASAAAAGDEAAEKMLQDALAERYPVGPQEYGSFLRTGKVYQLRTVSDHFTGIVVNQTATEILLGRAAWIPDMGRYSDALQTGTFNEVEPIPGAGAIGADGKPLDNGDGMTVVMRQAIVSYVELHFDPPRQQK